MKIKTLASTLALGLLVTGCARLTETGMVIFASTLPAFAVVNGQMMAGEVQLVPDRTGSVALRTPSVNDASAPLTEFSTLTSCMGRLRFTSTAAGEMDLRCNDASTTTLHFSLIADATGYAYNQTTEIPASLTFGLRAPQAKAYLQAPVGKQIVESAGGVGLELR
jgi:hypothetical protein